MTRPQKRDSLAGYALAAAIGIVALIVVSLIGMSQADAGGHRQRAVCNVVQAPVYQQAAVIAYPGVIGYQVGQHLQQQAVDEYGFRSSASQQRLTFLEGYYQAKQEEAQAPPQVSETETSEPQAFSAPQPPAAPGVHVTPPGGIKPDGSKQTPVGFLHDMAEARKQAVEAPQELRAPPTDFATAHPTLAASCKGCHADAESEGGFSLADEVMAAKAAYGGAGDCDKLLAIADSIATGRMPEGKPLSDADARAAIVELLSKPQ